MNANPRPSRVNCSASTRTWVIVFGSPEKVRAIRFGAGIESAVRIASNGRSMFPSKPIWLVGDAWPFVSPYVSLFIAM